MPAAGGGRSFLFERGREREMKLIILILNSDFESPHLN